MKNTLPLLNALGAFEAAARHLSFTAAAKELNVLQPAVSRHISNLEKDLGAILFLRLKPRLKLTADGETLLAAVTAGLGQIDRTANLVRNRNRKQSLVIYASIGFASCFLMSRLSGFNTRHPEVELELVTNDFYRDYNSNEFDVAIVFSNEEKAPGHDVSLLFPGELIAVCSPEYIGERAPLDDASLVKERLLYQHDPIHLEDWNKFLCDSAVKPPESTGSNRYTTYITYLQAALNGEGITLGNSTYLDDLIKSGRLCLASHRRVQTRRSYYCCLSERGLEKPAARDFANWLHDMIDLR